MPDIDLLAVAPIKQPFLDKTKLMLVLNTLPISLQPVGYTSDEFEYMVTGREPFDGFSRIRMMNGIE